MRMKYFLSLPTILLIMAGCATSAVHSSYNNKSAIWQDTKSHDAVKELNKQLPDK